jgi:hypothetical protein
MIETTFYDRTPVRADGLLYNDRSYDGLRATDGTDISSRSKHREYMKINGLTTADDFKGTWSDAQKQRDDYYSGKKGSVSKMDIERAIHQLQTRKR